MRAYELMETLEKLIKEHSNCYVLIDSDYEGEVSVNYVEAVPYHETKYFVIKS